MGQLWGWIVLGEGNNISPILIMIGFSLVGINFTNIKIFYSLYGLCMEPFEIWMFLSAAVCFFFNFVDIHRSEFSSRLC